MRVAPELSTIFGIITIFFFFLSLENFRPPLLSLPVRPYSVHAKYGAGKARRRAESRDRVNWEFQRANHVDATCAHDAPGRPAGAPRTRINRKLPRNRENTRYYANSENGLLGGVA